MPMMKGVVSNTSAKDWDGRNGKVTLYSFQIEGDKSWYRCGTNRPNFEKGESIEFQYVEDGKGGRTLQEGSVTKVASAPAQRAPSVGKAVSKQENWDARAAYWDAKEKREIDVVEPRITLSASRTAAIAVVGLALQHDAIVFGNASKGARLGIILDAIDEVTSRYYDQSMKGPAKISPEAEVEIAEASGDSFDD